MKDGAVSDERSPENEAILYGNQQQKPQKKKKRTDALRKEVQLPRWFAGTACLRLETCYIKH